LALDFLGRNANDPETLKFHVERNDRYAVVSAYLLGWRDPDPDTIILLQRAATSKSELLAVTAVEAICRFGIKSALVQSKTNLREWKDPVARVRLAALMAANRDYEGWYAVRDSIILAKKATATELGEALDALQEFREMRDATSGESAMQLLQRTLYQAESEVRERVTVFMQRGMDKGSRR